MKILIVEDEWGVAQNLTEILKELEPDIQILAILESVEEVIQWVNSNGEVDLGFFDIRLADGNSFEIFESVHIDFPVIFTTAYDEFAIKAFKVNSIDYLLKPLDKESIAVALKKYKKLYTTDQVFENDKLLKILNEIREEKKPAYKKNFLVYFRDRIKPVSTKDIAYFFLIDDTIYLLTFSNEKRHLDQSLDRIMQQLDPEKFFRANRQIIVSRKSIKSASQFFDRKLKLDLFPSNKIEVLISKSKVSSFKKWLES